MTTDNNNNTVWALLQERTPLGDKVGEITLVSVWDTEDGASQALDDLWQSRIDEPSMFFTYRYGYWISEQTVNHHE